MGNKHYWTRFKGRMADKRAAKFLKKATNNFADNYVPPNTGEDLSGLEKNVDDLFKDVKDDNKILSAKELQTFYKADGDDNKKKDYSNLLKKKKGKRRWFSAARTALNPFSSLYLNQDKVSRTVDAHKEVYNTLEGVADEEFSHKAAQKIRMTAGSSYQVKDTLKGLIVQEKNDVENHTDVNDKYCVEDILEKDERIGWLGTKKFVKEGTEKIDLKKTFSKGYFLSEEFTSFAFDATAFTFGGVTGLGLRRGLVAGLGAAGKGLSKMGQKYSENHGNLFGAAGTSLAIGGMAYTQGGALAATCYGGGIFFGSVLKHIAHRRMQDDKYLDETTNFNRNTHFIERISDAITLGIMTYSGYSRGASNDFDPEKTWENVLENDPVTMKAVEIYDRGFDFPDVMSVIPDFGSGIDSVKSTLSGLTSSSAPDETDYSEQVDSALEDGFGKDSVTIKDGDVYVKNDLDTTKFLEKLGAIDAKDDAITTEHVDPSFLAEKNPSNIHLDRIDSVKLGPWEKLVDFGRYGKLDAKIEDALGTDVDINPFDAHITVHNDGMDAAQMASKLSAAGMPMTLDTIEHYNQGSMTLEDFKDGDINIGYAYDKMYADTVIPKSAPIDSIDKTPVPVDAKDTPVDSQASSVVPAQDVIPKGFFEMPGDFYGKDVIVDKVNTHDMDGDPCKATGNEAHLTLNKDCYNDGKILPFETGKEADTTLPKDLTLDDTFMMFEKIGTDGKPMDRVFVDVDDKGAFTVPDDFRELYTDGEKVRVSHVYSSEYCPDNGHISLERLASWDNFKGKCASDAVEKVTEPILEKPAVVKPVPSAFADMYNITANVNGEVVEGPVLDSPLDTHLIKLGHDDKVSLGTQYIGEFDQTTLTLKDMDGNAVDIPMIIDEDTVAFCTNQLKPGNYMIDFHGEDKMSGMPHQHDYLSKIWRQDPSVNWGLEGPKDDFTLNDHDYLMFNVAEQVIEPVHDPIGFTYSQDNGFFDSHTKHDPDYIMSQLSHKPFHLNDDAVLIRDNYMLKFAEKPGHHPGWDFKGISILDHDGNPHMLSKQSGFKGGDYYPGPIGEQNITGTEFVIPFTKGVEIDNPDVSGLNILDPKDNVTMVPKYGNHWTARAEWENPKTGEIDIDDLHFVVVPESYEGEAFFAGLIAGGVLTKWLWPTEVTKTIINTPPGRGGGPGSPR